MIKTRSEHLFENLCRLRAIRYRRIAESKVRTPDYDIFVPRRKIIVEVKEFTVNKGKQHTKQERLKTDFSFGSVTHGDRVRKKILDAGPQMRRRTKNRFPGLLVLFDRGYGFNHLDSNSIRVAMYGLDTVQLAIPRDHRRNPYVVRWKSGPKRKMTPKDNTSISAIGALYCPEHVNERDEGRR